MTRQRVDDTAGRPDEACAPLNSVPGWEPSGLNAALYRNRGRLTKIAVTVVVTSATILGVVLWLTGGLSVGALGYAGIWLLSFVGAASVLIPVPGTAAACVGAAPAIGLNPLLIGIISGSAEALGELSGYMAGLGGRNIIQSSRFYPRVRVLLLRRGGWILFLAGIVPDPAFDLFGIAAGSAGYPVTKFIPVVFAAKAIKSTWVAFACHAGISWIEGVLG